jgi:hypothetical protein
MLLPGQFGHTNANSYVTTRTQFFWFLSNYTFTKKRPKGIGAAVCYSRHGARDFEKSTHTHTRHPWRNWKVAGSIPDGFFAIFH